MKILSALETRKADAFTIKHEPIKSIELMQRASEAFVKAFVEHYDKSRPVAVFCGTGNNGGDALLVSRLLHQKGYKVEVYIVDFKGQGSKDFLSNYTRHVKVLNPVSVSRWADIPAIQSNQVVIDAIFGSGLTRAVTGIQAEVINAINRSGCTTVAIDIPSGLFADSPSVEGAIIEADRTISLQLPKLAFFIPENRKYTGEWEFVDIGLSKDFINTCESSYYYMDREFWKGQFGNREKFAHKGNFGKALIISGSYGKMGAAVLAARACLRSGVGLLTMHIPGCGYEIMQTAVPEAMAWIDDHEHIITEVPDFELFNTVGVGPGIGQATKTLEMLRSVFKRSKNPMVIDADAINLIGNNRELLKLIPRGSILTPHLVEFERISQHCLHHFDRIERQKAFSQKHGLIVVLKGAFTSVSFPDGTSYFNSTGNPGMATGGSGDVLTGIITGLLAAFQDPEQAAALGVYLHGLAGDLASRDHGEESLIASDIIASLPEALIMLKKY